MLMRSLGQKLTVVLAALALPVAGVASPPNWPSFRGPRAAGVADGESPPSTWDDAEGVNIRWKTPIPGLGHSCPVIWGDRVLVTTAVSTTDEQKLKPGLYGDVEPVDEPGVHQWRVYCLDKHSGKVLWERTAHKGVPKIKRHPKSTHANATPATDGEHVVAMFGSAGLYCYGMSGDLRWKKDLGTLDSGWYVAPEAQWGYGSSPIIHENKVIVQCDVQKDSFIAAFDIKDGRELWRTPRDDVPTWATPTVHVSGGRSQVVVNGFRHIGGYDAATGEELWRLRGGGDIPVPTPVVAHGLVFITNSHGTLTPIYAIRLEARGDISLKAGERANEFVAWSKPKRGAYMPTPIVYGDYLYVVNDIGILSCYAAKTGEQVYRKRIAGQRGAYTASPVAAGGKLYFTSEDGDIHVVKAGPECEHLATNRMEGICLATPAISDQMLFVRTSKYLYAIGDTSNYDVARE